MMAQPAAQLQELPDELLGLIVGQFDTRERCARSPRSQLAQPVKSDCAASMTLIYLQLLVRKPTALMP